MRKVNLLNIKIGKIGNYFDCRSLGRDKELVKRNGEFTVNIALVKNGKPILGVIFVPVKGWLYYGSSNGSLEKLMKKKSSYLWIINQLILK